MSFSNNFKDFLTLGTSNLVYGIVIGVLWLYLAELLPKTQYGELGLLFSWINVAVIISLLGLRSTVMVYEPKNEKEITKN